MDQFTYAERATDWRGNNNIAESIFEQMAQERHPCPAWIVVGAGTGGTAATIGRYVRYRRYATRLCVADPEGSAFFDAWRTGDPTQDRDRLAHRGHRPPARRAVLRAVGDRPHDAGARRRLDGRDAVVEHTLGRHVGGSTGTNFWPPSHSPVEMRAPAEPGSIVTLICDGGERYLQPTTTTPGWPRQTCTSRPLASRWRSSWPVASLSFRCWSRRIGTIRWGRRRRHRMCSDGVAATEECRVRSTHEGKSGVVSPRPSRRIRIAPGPSRARGRGRWRRSWR